MQPNLDLEDIAEPPVLFVDIFHVVLVGLVLQNYPELMETALFEILDESRYSECFRVEKIST